MPTITVSISDMEKLLTRTIPDEDWLERQLSYVKGELKEWSPPSDEAKIELNDTNRPDLWCPEGIARQIRAKLTGTNRRYPFLDSVSYAGEILVDEECQKYRPYVAGLTARGAEISDSALRQLIQTQEKLSDTFGRRRKAVAEGVYDLTQIAFPVRYTMKRPDEASFVPLGYDQPWTIERILNEHPTALEYAAAVEGYDAVPVLVGADGDILSMPPIINSARAGAVEVGDRELFVEVTGTDLRQVVLALNIFAANLTDRGFTIEPVVVRYPFDTPLGIEVRTPRFLGQMHDVKIEDFNRPLGRSFEAAEIEGYLTSYGLSVEARPSGVWRVRPPFYRNDLLHPIDVVEDVAIALGYDSFQPEMPRDFTVGRLSAMENFSDEVRALLVESGFTEILSPILTHRDKLSRFMNLSGRRIIAIENCMTENYSCLRDAILPSLFEVETESAHASYPHFVFEAGEVAVRSGAQNMGSLTLVNVAAAAFHAEASFSEIHAHVDRLMFFLDLNYRLKEQDHPSAISGRAARIIVSGRDVGGIGEIHPQVLDMWNIKTPCAAFEINLDGLQEARGQC